LEAVTTQVTDKASRYLPDLRYSAAVESPPHYGIIPLSEWTGNKLVADDVGLYLSNGEGRSPFLFTDWSRSQLLSLLGTKERWFRTVSLGQQVAELNMRLHALEPYRIRLERAAGGGDHDIHYVRGIVSKQYAEITDVHVMEQLTRGLKAPVYALAKYTKQTDRASYAYLLSNDSISVTGGQGVLPGILVKNSEVGYTSLWVHLFLFFQKTGHIAVRKAPLLRRIHRGSVADLHKQFAEAQESAAGLWEDIQSKLAILEFAAVASEDAALRRMEVLCSNAGAPRSYTLRCVQHYKAAGHQVHTALKIFESVAAVAAKEGAGNLDQAHINHIVAGAVLFSLL